MKPFAIIRKFSIATSNLAANRMKFMRVCRMKFVANFQISSLGQIPLNRDIK